MKGQKTILTPEQHRWLVDNFPYTKNQDCALHLGISLRTVVRLARALALHKSREFMLMTQRAATNEARVMNRGDGNRGAINLLKYGEKYRFRKGETSIQRLGKEKEAERLRKAHATRNETISRERMRINWGLTQRTNLRLARQPKQWVYYRYTMKRRGYIVSRAAREIYYNENTDRSATVEHGAQAAGLIILEL